MKVSYRVGESPRRGLEVKVLSRGVVKVLSRKLAKVSVGVVKSQYSSRNFSVEELLWSLKRSEEVSQ